MYVGSLQSSYMGSSGRTNVQGTRKHPRLNNTSTDVHYMKQPQYVSQSDSNSLFSNLQFAPFSQQQSTQSAQQQASAQLTQAHQIIPAALSHHQQAQASGATTYFLSTSLPQLTNMDSLMMQHQPQQYQQQQGFNQQYQFQQQPAQTFSNQNAGQPLTSRKSNILG